jgi:hypothetical protein
MSKLLGERAKPREKIFASRVTNNGYISVLLSLTNDNTINSANIGAVILISNQL